MTGQADHHGTPLPRAVGHWPPGMTRAATPDGQIELQIVETADGPALAIDAQRRRKRTVDASPTEPLLDEANVRALQGLLAAAWARMTDG